MPLSPGARIGGYEILAALGAGGMGEVYRARDAKLNRDVALKVLPAAFTSDPDRLARFRREAQVLAALNHPNIAAVYGFEDSGSTHALVMELVAGDDLSTILARGPMPLADALGIARQIADALETAHEQGIVHRDLKPANVKIRADGTVKVLDFGLAKALTPASGPGSEPDPTMTSPAFTQAGLILGTAAYMSPEQARGRTVDRRTDIWAFGVVLYEMLAGRRAFDGDDVSITLANVLKEDVDWRALPVDAPAPIRRLLRRCLQKDPKRRLSAIGDVRLELDDAVSPPTEMEASTAAASPRSSSRLPWIAAAVVTLAWAVTVAALWPRPIERSVDRILFELDSGGDSSVAVLAPQLSPNGRRIAFVGPPPGGGITRVWIRELDTLEIRSLPGTEGASNLFWSPDSRQIGFVAAGKIVRISLAGGGPQPLCEFSNFAGGTWSAAGEILLATTSASGGRLFRVRETGGTPAVVAESATGDAEGARRWPFWLPDGKHFLYSKRGANGGIYAGSADGGPAVHLVDSDSSAMYSEGFLLFTRGGALFAQPFDAVTLTISGEPVRVAEDVFVNTLTGRSGFSVSTNGILTYRRSAGGSLSQLGWTDRTGKSLGMIGDPRNFYQIRLSPDGRRVAVVEYDATRNYRISALDLGNGVATPLSDASPSANDPVWGPDSETLVFEAVRDRPGRQLYMQSVGSPSPTLLYESTQDPKWMDDWSADGAYFLFHTPKPSKLFALPKAEPRTPMMLFDTQETIDGAHFSPDGKWVAYQLTEAGEYQVWVASFPSFDRRRRLSPQGGGQAVWHRDGKELFYLTTAGKMMSVGITARPGSTELVFAAPVELFQSPILVPTLSLDQYSVSKDGQRFLFIQPRGAPDASPPIVVMVNWAEVFKKAR